MIDRERLFELTELHLKFLISEASNELGSDFDTFTPFGDLGVDSFQVLEVIKKLEEDFGTLSKTLLFENFNINDLANYFVKEYEQTLVKKFHKELQNSHGVMRSIENPLKSSEGIAEKSIKSTQLKTANQSHLTYQNKPILILEKNAYTHAILGDIVKKIFNQYKNEGSASRGTRNIAPNLFIGSEKQGYINYARYKNIILAYSYTGPENYFTIVAHELLQYCATNNFEFNLLSGTQIELIGNISVSSTPFGVVQRIINIQDFTLKGSKMRRLRYQVSKFDSAGKCRTEEYICGSSAEIDQNIVHIIDQWRDTKTMVNPLINIVREEVLTGSLSVEHRIFITYLDDVLQNVILISPLASENGYLMDLEFYPIDMPMGGLEFAIVKMIEVLVAEGCTMLSLGGTYGCKLTASSNADPALDAILDHLRDKDIFNDSGNMQFKNKFRPENKSVYICRRVEGSNPNNITDIIMMIADPEKMQTSDDENHMTMEALDQLNEHDSLVELQQTQAYQVTPGLDKPVLALDGERRSHILANYGYNPLNLPDKHVAIDLKTDSWAQLTIPAIDKHMDHVHERLQQPIYIDDSLKQIFPFNHVVLADSGRSAEHLFYKASKIKGTVIQNLLFPTTIFNQIDNGFTPKELPCAEIFNLESEEFYKGNLDLEALQAYMQSSSAALPFICVEVSNNAAGGGPVSIQHLKKIKALLDRHSVSLVIDGTRVVENAWSIMNHEKEYANKNLWDVVREIFSYADTVVASLPKDFCVNRGGIIATNNTELFTRLQNIVDEEGNGLDLLDAKVIALALQNQRLIENQVLQKMQAVQQLYSVLIQHDIPVVKSTRAHCILIDVKQISEFKDFDCPLASFVAWIYLNTGIRCGAHSVGMQKNTTINNLVRLAIPIGLPQEQINDLSKKIISLFADKSNIPELIMQSGQADTFGNMNALYELVKYHSPSSNVIPASSSLVYDLEHDQESEDTEIVNNISDTQKVSLMADEISARPQDIAVIGMAGRYPKAKNLDELWQNLLQGIDCIEDIPEARLQQRLQSGFAETYRGGFIDDVDKFDAAFFNVSAKEAIMLDPQERLFLEVCWEALEDAGYYPEILAQEEAARDIGVFVGAVWSMYQMFGLEEKFTGNNTSPNSFFWSIANRVSFWMNLSGPSLTLDTACSSSLTAVNLACQAIHRGECSSAIVGGVNLDLHQSKFDINSVGGTLSKDGVCRSFGKGANGYVAGEGVGVLILKPLAQAIKDHDNIHGVIKSAVVNHNGRTSGYTMPSSGPQVALVQKALESAGVDAASIGYIEAHGTATELGDAIEISGLNKAFEKYSVAKKTCPIGSIKTNIGHLEAASGIVGMQKILLQMKHRLLVPSLHSAELNETIDFDSSPFYVAQTVEEWQAKPIVGAQLPLRAGISAFGAGGANAHVILEQYQISSQTEENINADPLEQVFPLSARTEIQLQEMAIRLQTFLKQTTSSQQDFSAPQYLKNISYTLCLSRKSFDYRLVLIAKNQEELINKLTYFIQGKQDNNVLSGHVKNADKITKLLNRKEKKDFLAMLSQSRDIHRLSQLWSDGLIIDWRGLQLDITGTKISLPTYPFADERYWISAKAVTSDKVSHSSDQALTSDLVAELKSHMKSETLVDSNYVSDNNNIIITTNIFKFALATEGQEQSEQYSVDEKSELFVKQLFSGQLNVPMNTINIDCHLLETGVTSIDMAEMTMSIKQLLDPNFSPTAFFECTTLRSLSALLSQTYQSVFEKIIVTKTVVRDNNIENKGTQIDNIPDAVLPSENSQKRQSSSSLKPLHLQDAESEILLVKAKNIPAAYKYPLRCVLLTGASGFLGIHILSEIMNTHAQVNVFCLVRAENKEHGLQRLLDQAKNYELTIEESRITVLCGDIETPQLGLCENDWNVCCREVQQIIHASAHVNHIEGYTTFHNSVLGMKEVIRLAGSTQLKLIHFVSSIAACMHQVGEEFSIFEKEDFIDHGEHVFGGYGQSKWVQETFLKKAHHDYSIPYLIYRFGELSGSSVTGLGKTDDMLHRLLQMRMAIGCKEKISSDVLDMLPVDFAAKLIINMGTLSELQNRILHATHLKPYNFSNFYRQVQQYGLKFDAVTRERYLAQCYDFIQYISTINPVNGFVLECVLRDAEGSSRNLKAMDGYFAVLFPFEQKNFKQSLQTIDLALPKWKPLFDQYLKRWDEKDNGFMARIFDYQAWCQLSQQERTARLSTDTDHQSTAKKHKKQLANKKAVQDESYVEELNEA